MESIVPCQSWQPSRLSGKRKGEAAKKESNFSFVPRGEYLLRCSRWMDGVALEQQSSNKGENKSIVSPPVFSLASLFSSTGAKWEAEAAAATIITAEEEENRSE